MSLHGTNSYVVAAPGSAGVVVVDPGPLDEDHLRELTQYGAVELILITHRHADHTAAAARFAELTGAPVRAAARTLPRGRAASGGRGAACRRRVEIRVLATPGHTSDSVCFHLPQDGAHGAVLTGDTILGVGTTVLDYPDGKLGDYLESLDRLESLGPATVLPAHGPMLPALDSIVRAYRDHRQDRLAQIRTALAELGAKPGVGEVADAVYAAVDPAVRPAAELSVAAQLDYLRSRGPAGIAEAPGLAAETVR